MARKKIKSATDQRRFTLVYNDFLESDILDYYEKMVFIALKKFADNETMRAFPSMKTIHNITGISLSQVKRSIEHMEELGVISVEHRTDKEKGHQSNIYTLFDYAEIWKVDSSNDDVTAVVDEISEAKLVAELKARGYTVTKEKEPDTSQADQSNNESSAQFNQFDIVNNTTKSQESQEVERYSLVEIRDFYEYEIMVSDNPFAKNDIDSVIDILHTNLNTTKKTIKIGKEDKPAMVVISKLLKLTHSEIMYAIDKFKEQTHKINNPISYMLTLLYNSKEQMNLDKTNQVQHDMYHWEPPTE